MNKEFTSNVATCTATNNSRKQNNEFGLIEHPVTILLLTDFVRLHQVTRLPLSLNRTVQYNTTFDSEVCSLRLQSCSQYTPLFLLPSPESGDRQRVRVTNQNKITKKYSRSTRPNLELTVCSPAEPPLSRFLATTHRVTMSSRAGCPSCGPPF